MRTVTFLSVYAGAADVAGLDLADMSTEQLASLVRKINRRVKKAMSFERWPELCPTELRYYRNVYSIATAYAAPTATSATEVFFIAAGKYYQALRASTGEVPATLNGTTYEVNADYWAECAGSYSGSDWADATAYAVGDFVRNADDGRFYACHTAHTSSGSFDATKFGVLTPFEPYVGLDQTGKTPIGEVLRITRNNPAVTPDKPGVIAHTVSASGIVPFDSAPPVAVWVNFRRRVPVFTNEVWSAVTAYAADQLVYVPATGECYKALQATTNNAPASSPTYWEKVDFPLVISDFVTRAAGSDVLRSDGNPVKADREQAQAYNELNEERDTQLEGQGISESTEVQTY